MQGQRGTSAPGNVKARSASVTTFWFTRKTTKIVATRHVSTTQNISKCVCGWGAAPDFAGELTALHRVLDSMGLGSFRGGEKGQGREWKDDENEWRMKEEWREGKGRREGKGWVGLPLATVPAGAHEVDNGQLDAYSTSLHRPSNNNALLLQTLRISTITGQQAATQDSIRSVNQYRNAYCNRTALTDKINERVKTSLQYA